MTDQELSTLLREWKSSAAPQTLEDRVFVTRRPWWDYIPGTPLAAFGALAGVLVVWSLSILAPHDQPKPPAAVPVSAPSVVPTPAPQPTPAPKPRPTAAPPKTVATKSAPVPPLFDATQPRLLLRVDPAFTPDTPPALFTSMFKVRIQVGKDGHVTDAYVLDGEPALRDLAMEAVKQWIYAPKVLNGESVEAFYEIEVSFQNRPRPTKGVAR